MPFNTRISLLALSAALASTSALAQQSLPTIEVGGAPLRSTSHPPVRAGVRAPGPRVAQAPTQQAPAAPSAEPSEPVSPIVRYAVPTATYTVSGKDFQNTRQFEMSSGMQQQMPGVIINDVGGNPFQPEIDYRGFNASPIAGTPQGLAVYQNGIRINEAWGDNVNWDLIPNVAIDRLSIVTGNPLFGLNAIGGAVTVDMKNGFTWQGFELDGRFGSRSRRQGTMQYGVRSGDFASYMAMEAMGDKGYRQFSGSNVKRFYGDVGYRGESGEIHANITLGHNKFGASGPAPVELTYIDESAAFTTPQTYKNTLAMYDLNGTFQPSETWKLFGDVHYRAFDQARVDGNTTEFECEPGEEVCENENGGETGIPNYFNGQLPIGAIDRTWTRSRTIGGTVQATNEDHYFGFHNKFTVGVSYDHGWTSFSANEELGIIMPNLVVGGFGHIVEEPNSAISSVAVKASNDYLGVYALDALDITDRLTATVGARFNRAGIALYDMRGTALNGNGVFTRINPMAGLTYKILENVTAYASYSEANRAPTPLELGCADPNRPCLIDNFLVADPPLNQVVAHTIETGLRGNLDVPTFVPAVAAYLPGRLDWSAGLFRTNNFNDILAVPSTINGRGYFTNAGNTLRQGVEVSLRYTDEQLSAYANYTLTDATFRSAIVLGAPDNPLAQLWGNGSIMVTPGANLTSVARHRFKAGADYAVTPKWSVGANVVYSSGPWIRGDEINIAGTLSPSTIVNLRTSYQLGPNIQVYGLLENVANSRTRSFGTFFDTGDISFLTFNNPRMVSLGPPLGIYGGVKITY
ncbi:TonB-dependent receptor [Methylocystis sp. WRRC1]|uniref:TonB-dependent receptor n=1 Tax=Methylocystis sp. WRRC1 TaxID=1732014 RepID=UPI001D14BD9F|nr:TonB-dependent receptor [Methylocystis sp. WRRC1]MCC3247156.1 TonB-dependent receptor [Methylocystis sp. WRRC1]